MATQPRNLFESALSRGRLVRQGEIACLVMDGAGAVVVSQQELVGAQKWAQSRMPTANLLTDRARFLDKFTAMVSRPGSVQTTRGNDRQLEKLVRAMMATGYDLSDWILPLEFKSLDRPPPPGSAARPASDPAADPAEPGFPAGPPVDAAAGLPADAPADAAVDPPADDRSA